MKDPKNAPPLNPFEGKTVRELKKEDAEMVADSFTTAEELLNINQKTMAPYGNCAPPLRREDSSENFPPNLTSNNKKMSLIKKAFQSKESKAVQNLGLGENKNSLNVEGQGEFVQYLYETDKDAKKGFLAKLVELDKESK